MRHLDSDGMLLNVLTKPGDWHIVSTLFPPDIQPAEALPTQEQALLISSTTFASLTFPNNRLPTPKKTRQSLDHMHPFPQIAIVLQGEEYLVLLGKTYRCVPMTIAYIGAWEPHVFHPVDRQHPSKSFRIDLQHGRVFTRLVTRQIGGAEAYDVHLIPLPGETGQALEKQWQILQERNGSPLLVKRARLVHATASLLAELLDDEARGQRARALSREELFGAIKNLLSENYGQTLTLEMLSSLTGYSRFHFTRLFKRFTGYTVHEFLDRCRYEKACHFAEQGVSNKLIAAVLGFSSPTAFFHWRARWKHRRDNELEDGSDTEALQWRDPHPVMLLLDVLANSDKWRLVSTLFPSEVLVADTLPAHEQARRALDHFHFFRQVAIILAGEEYLILQGKIHRCGPMTVAYIDALEPHVFHPVNRSRPNTSFRIDLRNGHVFTRVVRRQVGGEEDFGQHDLLLPGEPGRALEQQWTALKDRVGPMTLVKRAKLIHATGSLLAELLDGPTRNRQLNQVTHEELFDSITELIRDSVGQKPNEKMLASLAGYSQPLFSRLFKNFTGQTIHQYYENCRYEKMKLLAEQGYSQKEIAAMLGFSSASALSHWRMRRITSEKHQFPNSKLLSVLNAHRFVLGIA